MGEVHTCGVVLKTKGMHEKNTNFTGRHLKQASEVWPCTPLYAWATKGLDFRRKQFLLFSTFCEFEHSMSTSSYDFYDLLSVVDPSESRCAIW